jgi:hypothetical protein
MGAGRGGATALEARGPGDSYGPRAAPARGWRGLVPRGVLGQRSVDDIVNGAPKGVADQSSPGRWSRRPELVRYFVGGIDKQSYSRATAHG